MSMDLDEILQVFFEETDDHLNTLETLLSDLKPSTVTDQNINAILRAAHSIKGNSATCGLSDVSRVAHDMESLLDVVRQKQGVLTAEAVSLLLEAKDLLSSLLNAYKSNMDVESSTVDNMCERLSSLKKKLPPFGTNVSDDVVITEKTEINIINGKTPHEKLETLLSKNERTLQVIFVLDIKQFPVEHVFQAISEFGEYSIEDTKKAKDQPYGQEKILYHLNLITAAPENEIRDTLGFVVDDPDSIMIDVIQGGASEEFGLFDVVFEENETSHNLPEINIVETNPNKVEDLILADLNANNAVVDDPWGMDHLAAPHERLSVLDGLKEDAKITPIVEIKENFNDLVIQEKNIEPVLVAGSTTILDHPLANPEYMAKAVKAEIITTKHFSAGPTKGLKAESRQFQRATDRKEAAADAVSLRVNLHKIEQVVDLVGELVIAQNQLQENIDTLDPVIHSAIYDSLQFVVDHTKALQESVLSIRMTPMSIVFNRFYRMVRELNAKLGKNVVMKTMGENTEMDKILVEKLVDPLSHIIRNSMDHGIETTEERKAAGKSSQGYILLRAFHRANSVIIEILDDGKGMHRDKILQKAEERGILRKDPSEMTDSEVWNLIFEPGFSTAAVVTDVSGRGVGMDVVRQNIAELNGKIDIFSAYGKGMKITLTLPLTLSILDGLFFKVGEESFVVPVSNVKQTLTPDLDALESTNNFGKVVCLNDKYLTVVNLYELFDMPKSEVDYKDGVWMLLESGDQEIILWVDKLEGQQQIVLKSLEKNYKKSAGIFGATIRNDGTVSLIVEPGDIIDMASNMGSI